MRFFIEHHHLSLHKPKSCSLVLKKTANEGSHGKKVKWKTKWSITATNNNAKQIFTTASNLEKKKWSLQARDDDGEHRSNNEEIKKLFAMLDGLYTDEFEGEGGEVNIF